MPNVQAATCLALAPIDQLDSKMMNTEKLQEQLLAFIRERQIQHEQFTENQLAELIRQILASGDIIKLVTTDARQTVIYAPFSEVERLKARVAELEAELEQANLPRLAEVQVIYLESERNALKQRVETLERVMVEVLDNVKGNHERPPALMFVEDMLTRALSLHPTEQEGK